MSGAITASRSTCSVKYLPLLLQLLAVGLYKGLVVLLGELRQAELVVFRVAKVFLREDLPLILHTLRLIEHWRWNVAGLDLITLFLLFNNILLDAFVKHLSILTFHALLGVLLLNLSPYFFDRFPILHRTKHLTIRHNQVFIVLDKCWRPSSVEPLLIMFNHWDSNHAILR